MTSTMDVYAPPNILRLTGVTLADYVPVEDVADSRLTDADRPASPEEPPSESYYPPDKIPRVFTGLDDWPYGTNLQCWMCGFTFNDRPKFVPTHVREGENGGIEFGVLGNMCTFNCAELWIETHLGGRAGNEERWRSQDNLCLVYFLFTGCRVSRIKPAPRKTELKQYGGEWDEEKFWQKMRDLDPVAGLNNHTPGSVVPERERVKAALATVRSRTSLGSAVSRDITMGPGATSTGSVWKVCTPVNPGPPAPLVDLPDSVDIVFGDAGDAGPVGAGEDQAVANKLADTHLNTLLAHRDGPGTTIDDILGTEAFAVAAAPAPVAAVVAEAAAAPVAKAAAAPVAKAAAAPAVKAAAAPVAKAAAAPAVKAAATPVAKAAAAKAATTAPVAAAKVATTAPVAKATTAPVAKAPAANGTASPAAKTPAATKTAPAAAKTASATPAAAKTASATPAAAKTATAAAKTATAAAKTATAAASTEAPTAVAATAAKTKSPAPVDDMDFLIAEMNSI